MCPSYACSGAVRGRTVLRCRKRDKQLPGAKVIINADNNMHKRQPVIQLKANLFKKRKRMQEEARCRKRNLCPTEIHRYIDSRLA